MQVYHQALNNNPAYARAKFDWLSSLMNLPIAKSNYLTQVVISGNASRNYSFYNPSSLSLTHNYNWQYGYSLSITQPIFNLAAWHAIKSTDASVKAATANFFLLQQTLMQQTVTAYLNVLKAQNVLRYVIANKKAILKQLTASEIKFKTGVIAITDVYNAKSSYAQILAQQITAENNLNIALEALRVITGHYYTTLCGITKHLPLLRPIPANIERWVDVANRQNYNIRAQKYNVIAAMDTVKQRAAGALPVLNVSGGYSQSQVSDNSNARTSTDNAALGLNLTYSPIQGGRISASTEQARYNYLAAASKLEEVHRQVVSQTRSSFINVMFTIDQTKIDKLRISTASDALAATEAGLSVGTRTMVDVLSDLTTLYQAQQKYVTDQYNYIEQFVSLKIAAGTLSVADLKKIKNWLRRPVLLHPLHWHTKTVSSKLIDTQTTKIEQEVTHNHVTTKMINAT